jgi:hypothetical protein
MKAKPDCTGQRFGRLVVLGKGDKHPKTNVRMWRLRCDCGKETQRVRSAFDTKKIETPSCGCKNTERISQYGRERAKPDCIGQRFGYLTVIRKGELLKHGKERQLYEMQCDCGKVVSIPRGYFDCSPPKQISCGCARKRKNKPVKVRKDIAGKKFGNLTAIRITGTRDKEKKPLWQFQCDCGAIVQMSISRLNAKILNRVRINCGDRAKHPDRWLEYPPTPNPYPKEAGELLVKYLPLTELNYQQIDSAVEDEKRDHLIRAAWIITYRRQQGEEISELHESRIIKKHLRYCSINVFWRRKLESQGGFLYNASGIKKELGGAMTDTTLNDYPVIETQGINMMPVCTKKHFKFKRC